MKEFHRTIISRGLPNDKEAVDLLVDPAVGVGHQLERDDVAAVEEEGSGQATGGEEIHQRQAQSRAGALLIVELSSGR